MKPFRMFQAVPEKTDQVPVQPVPKPSVTHRQRMAYLDRRFHLRKQEMELKARIQLMVEAQKPESQAQLDLMTAVAELRSDMKFFMQQVADLISRDKNGKNDKRNDGHETLGLVDPRFPAVVDDLHLPGDGGDHMGHPRTNKDK